MVRHRGADGSPPRAGEHQPAIHVRNWRRLRRRTLALLAVWFVAGPLLGILLAERVNALSIAGAPLGFWIAQQGAIYVFVILIFLNAWLADRAEGGAAPATPPPSPASGGSTLAPDAPAAPAPSPSPSPSPRPGPRPGPPAP